MVFKKMIKTASPKAIIIGTNLICLAFFLILYVILLLCPSASDYHDHATSFVKCSFHDCHHKKENGVKMKAILEEPNGTNGLLEEVRRGFIKREKSSFLNGIGGEMKIGLVNMDDEDISEWKAQGQIITVIFEKVSELIKWEVLFPEWIDEEGASCPKIPMPDYHKYGYMDVIVAKLPCKIPEDGWNRDVFRLQVHLIVANLVARRGRRDQNRKLKVVFVSKCMPMVELFRCDDLVRREGEWWYYKVEMNRMEQKVSLPVGSCKSALPLLDKGINNVYNVSKRTQRREAYATVIHSSEAYVCGAITLAQSLLQTLTKRDLILLLDTSISEPKREALIRAGWKLRFINRIRNPNARNNSYNKYNYSKFRLWQLTDYDKVIFIDSDIIILRNLDILFSVPQMSATGNNGSLFNSGIMLIEPSNCTFRMFMQRTKEIVSYNGGDQGFLNEVFTWWHRFPRRVNFMKYFWTNTSNEANVKNQLFSSDPPKLYSIHYLGLKPWLCYKDYDCNFDVPSRHVYASDAAHARWWKLYDAMDERLQKFCALSNRRKVSLERNRKEAQTLGSVDHHWKINVTDPRKLT